ncbi:hypothetical protein AB4072_13310 [Microvirga sp. 2MCAF38]|uniref:hypothetical protein n=1 Tax=Microvirga sp. 2MCAF38 TaxID=3232989 RepID=UPI003F9486C3
MANIFAIAFSLNTTFNFTQFDQHDPSSYISHAFTIGIDFDLDYSNELSFLIGGDINAARTSPTQPVGPGIVASPFVAAFSIIDRIQGHPVLQDRTQYLGSWSYFGIEFAALFYFLLGIALYQRALRAWLHPALVALICFSVGLLPYVANFFTMGHAFEFFTLALFVYAVSRLYDPVSSYRRIILLLLVVMSATLIIMIRWVNWGYLSLPLLIQLSRYLTGDGRMFNKAALRTTLSIYLAIGVSLLLVSLFYAVNFGMWWPKIEYFYSNARHRDVSTTDLLLRMPQLLKNIPSLLLSSEFGLLYSYPIFPIAGIAALFLWFRNVRQRPLPWTGWFLSFCWCIALPLAIVLMWQTTASGYGYRYLLPALPALLVAFAVFANTEKIEILQGRDGTWARGAVAMTMGFFIALAVISIFAQSSFNKIPGTFLKPQINVFGVEHGSSGRGYMDAVFGAIFSPAAWLDLLRQSLFHAVARTTTATRANPQLLTQLKIILLVLPTLGAIFSLAACLDDKRKVWRISLVALIALLPLYALVTALQTHRRTFTRFEFGIPAAAYFVGKGFSLEQPGVPLSWVLANPAELHGLMPRSGSVEIKGRLYNPHPGQMIEIAVNGRVVGAWKLEVGYSEPSLTVALQPDESGNDAVVQFRVGTIAAVAGSGDDTKRGIMFEWLAIEPAQAARS